MPQIRIKRVYDPPAATDGQRILVDALWPRGLSKADAKIDVWLKRVAPSMELRRWFAHDPARWEEFRSRYHDELGTAGPAMAELRALLARGPTVLVFAARDDARNNAVALRDYLMRNP